jgi:hypothetical protein
MTNSFEEILNLCRPESALESSSTTNSIETLVDREMLDGSLRYLLLMLWTLLFQRRVFNALDSDARENEIGESWILIALIENENAGESLEVIFTEQAARRAADRYTQMELHRHTFYNELALKAMEEAIHTGRGFVEALGSDTAPRERVVLLSQVGIKANEARVQLNLPRAATPSSRFLGEIAILIKTGVLRSRWTERKDWRARITTALNLFHIGLSKSTSTLIQNPIFLQPFSIFLVNHAFPYQLVNIASPAELANQITPKSASKAGAGSGSATFTPLTDKAHRDYIKKVGQYCCEGGLNVDEPFAPKYRYPEKGLMYNEAWRVNQTLMSLPES